MLNRNLIQSLYYRDKNTIEEAASTLKVSYWSLYNYMRKYNIKRRNRSETSLNYFKIKPGFITKTDLSIDDEKIRIAGIMLYCAEGRLKNNTVDFANSNPEMIKIFLKFLRLICGVSEDRLRVYVYAYDNQDIKKIKNYWSEITNIPLKQFTKPYIRKGNPNLSNRKLDYGLIHVRYNDKKLLDLVRSWIEEFKLSSLSWAGTQVAKGDRLYKSSVLLKGRMEKWVNSGNPSG